MRISLPVAALVTLVLLLGHDAMMATNPHGQVSSREHHEVMGQEASSCAAVDKDLAFIEQTIPHHQMAIDTSEAALTDAEHEEIREIAEDVIDVQEQEIAELEAIRAELTGETTPES